MDVDAPKGGAMNVVNGRAVGTSVVGDTTVPHAVGMGGGGEEARRDSHESVTLRTAASEEEMAALVLRMKSRSWRVHVGLGIPVCEGALSELQGDGGEAYEGDEVEACPECESYCRHVATGIASGNSSLCAAIRVRDIMTAERARAGEVARMEGEIQAIRSERDNTRDEMRVLQRDGITLAVILEKEKAKSDTYLEDYNKAAAEIHKYVDMVEQLEKRIAELEEQLTQVDENRVRKKCTPVGTPVVTPRRDLPNSSQKSKPVSNSGTKRTMSVGNTDEDVDMADGPGMQDSIHAPGKPDMQWGNLRGIPLYITGYPIDDPSQFPPPPEHDFVETGTLTFSSIARWNDALEFAHASRCWPLALAVFRVYYEGRTLFDTKQPVSEIQLHALSAYKMPEWFGKDLRKCAVDSNALKENRMFWSSCSRPSYGVSVREAAAFIQRHGRIIDGCPFIDNYHSVNSQDVAGWLYWNTICYNTWSRDCTIEDKAKANIVTYQLLAIFAVPRQYADHLDAMKLAVAPITKLDNWPREVASNLDTNEVMPRLARMGVTVDMANEMYSFADNYLSALLATPELKGWNTEDLIAIKTVAGDEKRYFGELKYNKGFVIPRVPGLPWHDVSMNYAQDDGVFLENIPTLPAQGHVLNGSVTLLTRALPTGGAGNPRIVSNSYPKRGSYRGDVLRGRGRGVTAHGAFRGNHTAGPHSRPISTSTHPHPTSATPHNYHHHSHPVTVNGHPAIHSAFPTPANITSYGGQFVSAAHPNYPVMMSPAHEPPRFTAQSFPTNMQPSVHSQPSQFHPASAFGYTGGNHHNHQHVAGTASNNAAGSGMNGGNGENFRTSGGQGDSHYPIYSSSF
ncbi:hypothetical protein C8F04DRAFT_1269634 [Mycena alexandri]|uniref:Uncharacterized protein n=1 Tax=Mycena alexandri TaxID=1745969 RepID=A0AAD6SDL0_9AGAR|nr:hypothetical protein C8F04DRAFT_1269634 [Mycena alexandri]